MKGKPEEEEEGSSTKERCWNYISILALLINSLLSIPSIKNLNEEGEEGSLICSNKWSEIEDDVFGLILQRLCLTDYLRTQVVCSSWRSNVEKFIANKCCPPLPDELPLVFLQTKTNDSNKHVSFFNLSTKSVSPCSGISSQLDCYGTIQGWLIMVDQDHTSSRRIFFFNPLTKARVLMPSRLQCKDKITKIVASAKPSDPDCVVVCLFVDPTKLVISGIYDESWTLIKGSLKERIIVKEVEILDGKLYALNHLKFDSIIVCDLRNKARKPKLVAAKNIPSETIQVNYRVKDFFRFLAVDASSRELLLIHMFYNSTLYGRNLWDKDIFFVPNFVETRVYKLSMNMSNSEAEWIKVENLGNRMLFVGKRKSLVVSSNIIGGPHQHLMNDNCIYFTCQVTNKQCNAIKVGRYCESDKKTDHYTCKTSMSDMLLSSIWFIPSFW